MRFTKKTQRKYLNLSITLRLGSPTNLLQRLLRFLPPCLVDSFYYMWGNMSLFHQSTAQLEISLAVCMPTSQQQLNNHLYSSHYVLRRPSCNHFNPIAVSHDQPVRSPAKRMLKTKRNSATKQHTQKVKNEARPASILQHGQINRRQSSNQRWKYMQKIKRTHNQTVKRWKKIPAPEFVPLRKTANDYVFLL